MFTAKSKISSHIIRRKQEEMSEAFVYLWYDAPNDMYYLGKHKGSPDDTYTHSSSIWESFAKNNIPEGVTREIISEGTDEEMCILEHKLLIEAKNGEDWDRYYNQALGDPRYVDQYGKNNPNFEHGIYALNSETIAEYESMKSAIKRLDDKLDFDVDILKDIRGDIKKRNYKEYSKEELVRIRNRYKDKVKQLKGQIDIAVSELYYWKEGWTQQSCWE
jgi:hypothetical protein